MSNTNKGQSLFEVLFATALAALIVTGVAAVATVSVRNAEFARTQSEARQVAQRMLEEARIFRDEPSNNFFGGAVPDAGSVCPPEFTCSYDISGGADTKNVVANVSWTDGTGIHTVSAETILTAWEL